jgi:hypothetical protein
LTVAARGQLRSAAPGVSARAGRTNVRQPPAREEADRYPALNFELGDRVRLLDEACASVEGRLRRGERLFGSLDWLKWISSS